MVVVIVLGPWIGARSDHRGPRSRYLVPATRAGGGAHLLPGHRLALLVAGPVRPGPGRASTSGSVVYDAMLPDVSTPENIGRVSGIGIAVGYLGSLVAWGIGKVLLDAHGYPAVFRAIAVAFLLFALPVVLLRAGAAPGRGAGPGAAPRRQPAPPGRRLAADPAVPGGHPVPGGPLLLHRRGEHPDRRVPHHLRHRGGGLQRRPGAGPADRGHRRVDPRAASPGAAWWTVSGRAACSTGRCTPGWWPSPSASPPGPPGGSPWPGPWGRWAAWRSAPPGPPTGSTCSASPRRATWASSTASTPRWAGSPPSWARCCGAWWSRCSACPARWPWWPSPCCSSPGG